MGALGHTTYLSVHSIHASFWITERVVFVDNALSHLFESDLRLVAHPRVQATVVIVLDTFVVETVGHLVTNGRTESAVVDRLKSMGGRSYKRGVV